MRQRLGGIFEAQHVILDAFAEIDPGLTKSLEILMPSGLQKAEQVTFFETASDGDILKLLRLGTLPELSLEDQMRHPSVVVRTLYALQRCTFVFGVASREMAKLHKIMEHIKAAKTDFSSLSDLVATVSLGNPIGCICPPGENDWHLDGNRFDLIAYDILAVNGLRNAVVAQLEEAPPTGVEQLAVAAWSQLLRSEQPYPDWKE